ncbi:DNA polymerase 1 [Metallosphaera sp. J1]|uniref:DNA polymerase domain-containing protein n=1 Tax=Metallosphaera TaxID=41980 RepID=UPI001EDE9CF8|nr:DNA polymerase domain-containing protein [Metallosphaera javensis (ex Hofmann et al. 2022)]MCG3108218.1 DNA polymerase 1 [Metallosphaera javensis (ex Hofmann et al. 2022)]BCS93929.1 MAG: DNA polymerase II [Metallosphaera javensis (ex Sakai et al. 2022)]
MEGYVIDAVPYRGRLKIVLDGFREAWVRTTYPIYVMTDKPEAIMEHPSVVSHEEEDWRTLSGERVKLHRYELTDLDAWSYISRRATVVNQLPTVLSLVLDRLGARPFRKVKIEDGRIVESWDPGLSFPPVRYATVITHDWYGPAEEGGMFEAEVNGEVKRGFLRDLDLEVDVAGCFGRACDHVRAPVKIRLEHKKSPVSVKGLIEWSYTCKTPLKELVNATIGKALTTNEAWVAFERKVVVPNLVPRVEKLRDMDEMLLNDKGGLVFFPRVGCFDDAWQIDFSSMYPSLIVKYNISGETVDACDDVVTEIGHTICNRERGIVPEALSWLIGRKEALKPVDPERAEAVKWILVASFGYLGYRNSKFGKIEAYELVTYYARKTLRRAVEIAREMGVEVLHGIVDSLVVRGDAPQLVKRLEEETGLRLRSTKLKWIVLGRRRDGLPYPMRYFGMTEEGMKYKGVIRRNMPNLVKEFLESSMEILSRAESCDDLSKLRSNLVENLMEYERRVMHGEPRDFVMWIRGEPYVRGVRGFYNARDGFMGRDSEYYLEYLRRTAREVLGIG